MRYYIIADNQFITREGIASLLSRSVQAAAILMVTNRKALQEKLNAYPDAVVVLDYTLFDFVSMEQMFILKTAFSRSLWILFSEELGEYFIRQVLITDPSVSIVMKNDSEEQITEALLYATNGTAYISESAAYTLNEKVRPPKVPDKLTPSEKVILHEIALGKTTKEIAYEKNVSFHTVNSHRKNIFRKLEVNNVHEAIKYAIRAGIMDVAEYNI